MPLRSYRDLQVWQKAMDFADSCYTVAAPFPSFEQYGMRSQLQRSAASIPANIAEGYGRRHRGDYLHHLSIASGSLAESETHLLLALRRKYLSADDLEPLWMLAQELGEMLRQQMWTPSPKPRPTPRSKINPSHPAASVPLSIP